MNVTEPIIQAALLEQPTVNSFRSLSRVPSGLWLTGSAGKPKTRNRSCHDSRIRLRLQACRMGTGRSGRHCSRENSPGRGTAVFRQGPESTLSRLHFGTRYMLAYAYRLAQGVGKNHFARNTSSRLSGVPMTATNPLRFEETAGF